MKLYIIIELLIYKYNNEICLTCFNGFLDFILGI